MPSVFAGLVTSQQKSVNQIRHTLSKTRIKSHSATFYSFMTGTYWWNSEWPV